MKDSGGGRDLRVGKTSGMRVFSSAYDYQTGKLKSRL